MCLKWKNIFIRKSSFGFKTFSPWTWYPYFGLSSKHLRTAVLKPFEAQWIMTMKTSAIQNYHLRKLFESATPRLRLISVLAGRDEWSVFAFCETQFCTRTQVSLHTGSIHSICCSYCIFNMYLHIYTKHSQDKTKFVASSQVTSNGF